MTPNDVILETRGILNDTDADAYRYSDADLLRYFNDAVKSVAVIRPEFFTIIREYTCIPGQCEQSLDFEDAVSFISVLSHHDGQAIVPADLATMDAFHPSWRTDPEGPAIQWMQIPDDPLRFYIYPKAPIGQVIDVRYVRRPKDYDMDEEVVDLPDVLRPALVDYIVSMAESRDDEHVISQRAAQHMAQFVTRLKG